MKITRIDTLRLDEFPSLVYVLVHTDEGLVGLGETFFFADAVEAHLHAVAGYLLGQDPGRIETHATRAARLRRHGSERRRDARRVRRRHRALGSLRPGGRATAAPCARRCVPRLDPHVQHVRGVPLHPRRERPGRHELGPAGCGGRRARTRISTRSSTARTSSPATSSRRASPAMKIWPFDPYAEASLGHDITHRRPRSRARAVPEDPRRGRPRDRRHGRSCTRCGTCRPRAASRARSTSSSRRGSRIPCASRAPRRSPRCSARRASPLAVGETLTGLAGVPGPDRRRRRADRRLRRRLGRRHHGGAQGRGARRGVRAAGRSARLHGPGRLHGGDAPLDAPAERDDPGERSRVLERLVQRARDGAAGDRERDGLRARPGPASEPRFAPRSSSAPTRTSARLS